MLNVKGYLSKYSSKNISYNFHSLTLSMQLIFVCLWQFFKFKICPGTQNYISNLESTQATDVRYSFGCLGQLYWGPWWILHWHRQWGGIFLSVISIKYALVSQRFHIFNRATIRANLFPREFDRRDTSLKTI